MRTGKWLGDEIVKISQDLEQKIKEIKNSKRKV